MRRFVCSDCELLTFQFDLGTCKISESDVSVKSYFVGKISREHTTLPGPLK